jgi:hypothetical protein
MSGRRAPDLPELPWRGPPLAVGLNTNRQVRRRTCPTRLSLRELLQVMLSLSKHDSQHSVAALRPFGKLRAGKAQGDLRTNVNIGAVLTYKSCLEVAHRLRWGW